MRTLFIGKTWPEPASTAAGRRTVDVLSTLQALGDVHVASAASPTEFSLDLTDLGCMPHTIAVNDDAFDPWLAELAPDIVVFERFMTEEQFGWRVASICPDALRILDTSDLHCLREARAEAVKRGADPMSLTPEDLFNDTALRETAAILRCDLTLLVSAYETDLLSNTFGISASLLHTLPFMLTPLPALEDIPGFAERQHLMVIGNFLHAPNLDAARWLRERWPDWRAQFPAGTELHVYGGYADQKVRQLHRPELGFHIKGRADDAIATLKQYRLNLAYLRYGAGIKGKVADSWLAGTPTIASPIAAEGMHGDLPWGSTVSADPDVWISTAAKLYQDREAWQRAVTQGRVIAETCHHTMAQQAAFIDRLLALRSQLQRHRQHNLLGRMLYQNQFRSTEYFSRWITAKNR